MKLLDRFNLGLFSTIILLISIIGCILVFGWFDVNIITDAIEYVILDSTYSKIVLGVSIVLILLAVKSVFFNSYSREKANVKEGILLENDNGKLLISSDTIESLTNSVIKTFDSTDHAVTKVDIDSESQVKIFITLFVYPDAVIKDLSNKIQLNVKETIKKSLGLDVTEVNIRIKNIAVKK